MPPKKTVPKGRLPNLPKEKPKLRTPTFLKIKLPIKNTSKTVQNCISPGVLCKKVKDLTSSDKLELTNKVARAQLIKSEPIVFPSEPEAPQTTKVIKKRLPKKKKLPETNEDHAVSANHQTVSSNPSVQSGEVPVQTPKRKYVRKSQVNSVKQVPADTETGNVVSPAVNSNKKPLGRPPKRKLSNSTEETQIPTKRRWKQSRITDLKILVRRSSKASSNGDKPRKVTVAKPKLVRKRGPRGKKNVENAPDTVPGSPSILTPAIPDQGPSAQKANDATSSTNAGVVESRKTSVTSELSWTRDISDSSNTTTVNAVTSSDFVIFDKKLPEMKLTKIDAIYEEYVKPIKEFSPRTPSSSSSSSSSSDSDSSDSEGTTHCNSYKESDIVSRHSLNLSTSSESHRSPIITQKSISINSMNNNINKISKALDKLSSSLKKIDLEMINWVGYLNEDININGKKLNNKIHQSLQEESNIILQCRHVNKLLTDNEGMTDKELNMTENVEITNNEPFVKPSDGAVPKSLNKSSEIDKGNHSRDQMDNGDNKYDLNIHFGSVNTPYVPFEHSNDDEDALSIYAESIGFESNRNSISSPPLFNPEVEEYVPEPVTRNVLPKTITYNPTKITDTQLTSETAVQNVRPIVPVCEKQNADSTSVVKDTRPDVNNIEGIEKSSVPKEHSSPVEVQVKKGPCLLATIFKPIPAVKSVVFKGMCFFNLIASCKNQSRCRFPHIEPDPIDITAQLRKVSEDLFIQEYMLLKCWPGLRRNYGLCFVEECARRNLTRLLVEMAIDFVMKAKQDSQEDAALKVQVLEDALMHLNNIDLRTCEDLLNYVVQGKPLCDLFMETIANTQNFSRFKPVFVKLTQFVTENDKAFSLDVATHILERVAILPFNESLAWAVICVIGHTEAVIFENSMMVQFEKQLSTNEELQREFLKVKEERLSQPAGSQSYNPAPAVRQEVERVLTSPMYPEVVQRYTSPDTTHLDGMNKPPEEPIITRTINFDRTFQNYSSSSSEGTDEYPRTPKPNSLFQSWRFKGNFNKHSPQRFPMRRKDRQVTYGVGPSNFPRRPGPDFF